MKFDSWNIFKTCYELITINKYNINVQKIKSNNLINF